MNNIVLNAAGMKSHNQKRILNELRIAPSSRAELARKTGLTRSGVGVLVEHMIKEGLLREGDSILGKVGRTSVEIQLNAEKYFIAGINIARDCCSIGISDFCGNLKQISQIELEHIEEIAFPILERIYLTLASMLKNTPCNGTFLGIGITCPGPLDTINGRILNPPNFHNWNNLDISDFFKNKFECPVFLENNANALALAERYYGIGRNYPSYIEFVVDTGIGGGIILNGNLYKGQNGFGSDFGHSTIDIHGLSCSCGNTGCVELYASIPNIVAFARTQNSLFDSWKHIVDLAELGNPEAAAIVDLEATYLSAVLTSAMNILDIGTIILAGDITYKGNFINEKISSLVNRQFIGKSSSQVTIISSKMDRQANVLSCINLVLEQFIQNIDL